MRVNLKDLIAYLKEFDPESEVIIDGHDFPIRPSIKAAIESSGLFIYNKNETPPVLFVETRKES